ncbi:MAG: hypothetical protein KAY24_05970, partial [Candidatus Eisenbacteria sp.]|nr:hypothetical protein [Candidatus Eisenbacteria bacterium]
RSAAAAPAAGRGRTGQIIPGMAAEQLDVAVQIGDSPPADLAAPGPACPELRQDALGIRCR